MRKLYIVIVGLLLSSTMSAQQINLKLWGDDMPNYSEVNQSTLVEEPANTVNIMSVITPSVAIYLPSAQSRTGQAVLVCPGGSYTGLAYQWEGVDVARWLCSKGVVAVILKYRLPDSDTNTISYLSPILDAQRGIRLIRHNAEKWGVDPKRVGIMGFSAGGHLASTLSTHYDSCYAEPTDEIDLLSARPDFSILAYPVVTFKDDYTHRGSRNKLTRNNVTPELIEKFSNELHVTEQTPPTFLVHASDDKVVPVQNALQYYEKLVEKGVEAEMHIYPEGGHGFSLAHSDAYLSSWTDRLEAWLRRH